MSADILLEKNRDDARTDIIDVRFLLRVWLRWSWVLVILALLGVAKGVMDVQNLAPVYVAKMTVLPDSGGGAGGGQVGGVLGNLGLQIGSNAPTTFDRMKVVMRSLQLAEVLQKKYGMMQIMFAGSWDADRQQWKRPTGDEFERQQRISAFFGQPLWQEPSLESLARAVGGSVVFRKDKDTPFWEVSVSGGDRAAALRLLTIAYSEADELLRGQDRVESQQRRRYLESQLVGLTNVDVRQALVGLMSSEQRRAMMLESSLPYAARILEPPFVSEYPEGRNIRILIALPAIILVLAGLLVITAVALFRRE